MGTLSRNNQNQVQPPGLYTEVALTTPVLLGLFELTAAVHVARESAKNIKCRTIIRKGEEGQEDSKSTSGVKGIHSCGDCSHIRPGEGLADSETVCIYAPTGRRRRAPLARVLMSKIRLTIMRRGCVVYLARLPTYQSSVTGFVACLAD